MRERPLILHFWRWLVEEGRDHDDTAPDLAFEPLPDALRPRQPVASRPTFPIAAHPERVEGA